MILACYDDMLWSYSSINSFSDSKKSINGILSYMIPKDVMNTYTVMEGLTPINLIICAILRKILIMGLLMKRVGRRGMSAVCWRPCVKGPSAVRAISIMA